MEELLSREAVALAGGSLVGRPLNSFESLAGGDGTGREQALSRLRQVRGRYRYMNHLELQPQSLCLWPHFAHSQ